MKRFESPFTSFSSVSVRLYVLLMRRAAAFKTPRDELTESSSADQREPVELQGPEQSGPQVTLPRGHEGHRVHRDGSVPETQSAALRAKLTFIQIFD